VPDDRSQEPKKLKKSKKPDQECGPYRQDDFLRDLRK
jgi:hypothetical protein